MKLKLGRSTPLEMPFSLIHLSQETEACAMCLILATGANQQVQSYSLSCLEKHLNFQHSFPFVAGCCVGDGGLL